MTKKTEFIDCPECGSGVSMVTNPTKCYKCGVKVFSKHPEAYKEPDMVKAPPHYTVMDPQPKDLCVQLPFLEGNIVKYVCRHRHKGGLEDLQKAQEWLTILIEREYGENA
jgi:hypothetical protein